MKKRDTPELIMDTLNTYLQGNYVKKKLRCSLPGPALIYNKLKVGSRIYVTYGKAQRDKYGKRNP